MKLHYSGNHALVLGGSCDLAISLAERMIKAGLFPTMTYRNEKGLKHLSEKLKSYSGKYSSAHLDFSDRNSLNPLLQQTDKHFDFLIDFVQGDFESLIASANEEDIYRYFTENVSFRAEIVKRVARKMLEKKRGRLVYVSSSAVARPNPGQGFYAAAKLASEVLYRTIGLELAGHGVTAVTLRPGYIDGGRGKRFFQAHGKETLGKIPIRRALTADEVAVTILFLLSDSAKGFNATEISMDGGLTAGK